MRRTERDDAMIEWLDQVRFAEIDAVRYALAGMAGRGEPVSLRKAQWWVARMVDAGIIERARPTFRDGSVVWAAQGVSTNSRPNLHRQTVRHQLCVAAISARYLTDAWSWSRDRPGAGRHDHVADGVARRDGALELVEVELTAKALSRYQTIFQNHAWRLEREGVHSITYYCDEATGRIVQREAEAKLHSSLIDRFRVIVGFDIRGRVLPGLSPARAAIPVPLWSEAPND